MQARDWEDYYIPGTKTLKNLFIKKGHPHGEPDPDRLRYLEERAASVRILELVANPIHGTFDYDHMKAIHKHIFQDVYVWAGEERTAPLNQWMSKSGPDIVNFSPGDPDAPEVSYSYYPAGEALTSAAEQQYAKIAELNYLTELNHEEFVTEIAEIWGELNVIHSFREGNTRTQFIFFANLAENAGYTLNYSAFKHGSPLATEFIAARFYSQATGKNTRLAEVLSKTIHKK